MPKLVGLQAPPPNLILSFKIILLGLDGSFGPSFVCENNFSEDTLAGVGGKNSRGLVAIYSAKSVWGIKSTFFMGCFLGNWLLGLSH